jgi:hypothetical protein
MNLKKQNKISTPFRKWIRVELVFHFLPLFFQFFPSFLNDVKKSIQVRAREIPSLSRD